MKIVIVSDNHLDTQALTLIRERHLREADLFIHCGDSQLPFNHPKLEGYLVVRGNCDFDQNLLNDRVENLTSQDRLFVTHGHLYDVKYSLQRLYYKACELEANIVCYGHSHCIGAEMIEDILFINPGSVMLPRNTREKTYAILMLTEQWLEVVFYEVKTGQRLYQDKFER